MLLEEYNILVWDKSDALRPEGSELAFELLHKFSDGSAISDDPHCRIVRHNILPCHLIDKLFCLIRIVSCCTDLQQRIVNS